MLRPTMVRTVTPRARTVLVRSQLSRWPCFAQADEGEIANPTFEEEIVDDTGLRNRKLGDLPSEEPGVDDADGVKSAVTPDAEARSKSEVTRTLAYFSLGIISQAVVYVSMW